MPHGDVPNAQLGRKKARHCLAPPVRDLSPGAAGNTKPNEDSARPGGREAPARGGAGAGRALWGPVRCKMMCQVVAKAMAFAKVSGAA